MKRIIKLTEADLTRIVKRVIKESYVSENYEIITPEEIQRLKEELENLLNNHIAENMKPHNYVPLNHLLFDYNRWRKNNIGKFTRRHSKRLGDEIEYDELSKYEKEEYLELRKKNIMSIGKLFEELISNYEKQKQNLEDDSKMKNSIGDVLTILYGEYYDHLEHIMYPKKNED